MIHFGAITMATVFVLHFIADFVLQSNWMATNKSKRTDALLIHCIIYGSVFVIPFGIKFASIAFISHYLIDFVTSRITSRLWANNEVHWFFVTIGFDQMLHMFALFSSFYFLDLQNFFILN